MKTIITALLAIVLLTSCEKEDFETGNTTSEGGIVSVVHSDEPGNKVPAVWYGTYGCKADYPNYGRIFINEDFVRVDTKEYKIEVQLTTVNVKTHKCTVWITLANGQILEIGYVIRVYKGVTENLIEINLLDANKNLIQVIGFYKLNFSEPLPPIETPEPPVIPIG